MSDKYFESFTRSYWNYYLELEERMEATKKYVEYDPDNFKTYSSTYLMLMQAVCSEIDVVGKEIASHYSHAFEQEDGNKTINRWWFEIQDRLPNLNREISFSDSFKLNPWMNYRVVKAVTQRNNNGKITNVTNYNLQSKANGVTYAAPKWWNAYNKVKHKRVQSDSDGVNYKKANLQNLANAFAALYLLEFEFMKDIGSLSDRVRCGQSSLFGMGDLEENYIDSLFVTDDALNI
jgi:hypothetical protein